MKKSILFLFVAIIAMSTVLGHNPIATNSFLVPGIVTLEASGVKSIEYCMTWNAEGGITVPAPGIGVGISKTCHDSDNVFGCQSADIAYPDYFHVTVVDPVTGADGCSTIELTTINAKPGIYHFTLNGQFLSSVVTQETGTGWFPGGTGFETDVPEFTTIGAMFALIGAGAIAAKKRK